MVLELENLAVYYIYEMGLHVGRIVFLLFIFEVILEDTSLFLTLILLLFATQQLLPSLLEG